MWRSHSTHTCSTSLPLPLTRTVESPLFTHEHSSPLSLTARLHRCHTNCSGYINNGWTFSRQASYTQTFLFIDSWNGKVFMPVVAWFNIETAILVWKLVLQNKHKTKNPMTYYLEREAPESLPWCVPHLPTETIHYQIWLPRDRGLSFLPVAALTRGAEWESPHNQQAVNTHPLPCQPSWFQTKWIPVRHESSRISASI